MKRNTTFNNLLTKVNWPLKLVVPHYSRLPSSIKNNSYISVERINMSHWPINPRSNLHSLRFSTITRLLLRLNILSPQPSNVLVGALYYAYLYSYLKIDLVGANMDGFTSLSYDHQDKDCYHSYSHFYGTSKKFIYTDKSYTEYSSMSVELVRNAFIFSSIHAYSSFLKSLGFTLTNLSKYSLLDSIDLVDNTVV